MKLTIEFTSNGTVIFADNELQSMSEDEYYALLSDAIMALQHHALDQYSIDESIESID